MSTASNELRIDLERRILRALLKHLLAEGWQCAAVYDNERTSYPRDDAETEQLVFNLDEASVRFMRSADVPSFHARRKVEASGPVRSREANDWGAQRDVMHGVLLVLGNGVDLISDWNFTEGDRDGFNKAMDAFDAESASALLPTPRASKDDYHAALMLMEAVGGGFASHLAKAAIAADSGNWALLYGAFHDLLDEYAKLAADMAKHRRPL